MEHGEHKEDLLSLKKAELPCGISVGFRSLGLRKQMIKSKGRSLVLHRVSKREKGEKRGVRPKETEREAMRPSANSVESKETSQLQQRNSAQSTQKNDAKQSRKKQSTTEE